MNGGGSGGLGRTARDSDRMEEEADMLAIRK